MSNLLIKKKGSSKSGNHGHIGRPGLEGGSIPKGGNRVRLVGGGVSSTQPKPKHIPDVPKLSSRLKSGSIPKHVKGDTSGSVAYKRWATSNPDASEVDRSRMQGWFEDRAVAMEHNLDIQTTTPGQRDEDEDEDESEEKKPEEKKKPVDDKKKKGKKPKPKAKVKKKPKPKAEPKPKATLKKKPGKPKVSEEQKVGVLKTVKISKADYDSYKSALSSLKAGKAIDKTLADKMIKSGFLSLEKDGNYKPNKFLFGLIKAVEGVDALATQEIMRAFSTDRIQKKAKKLFEKRDIVKFFQDYPSIKTAGGITYGQIMKRRQALAKKYPDFQEVFDALVDAKETSKSRTTDKFFWSDGDFEVIKTKKVRVKKK